MATQDDYIRTALRVPPDLHARIHEQAKANNRTFNAEIVARLEDSFIANGGAAGVLNTIPVDLSSRYGLRLYQNELDQIEKEIGLAEVGLTMASEAHQRLLKSSVDETYIEKSKERMREAQERIGDLQKQANQLREAIDSIHAYRKFSGLPELCAVQSISS